MELDDFKEKSRQTKIIARDNDNNYKKRIDDLIEMFKSYQEKQRRKSMTMVISDCALGALYLAIMSHQSGLTAFGYFVTGAGLIMGALYLFLRYKPLSPQTYSLSMTEFLSKAEKKISYFALTDYLIVFVLLMILGTGGGFIFTSTLIKYTDNLALLLIIWIIFFLSLSVFGFWAGRKNWKKENSLLLKKITDMKNSYSENNDGIDQKVAL